MKTRSTPEAATAESRFSEKVADAHRILVDNPGMSYAEIADQLGVGKSSVGRYIARAREDLKEETRPLARRIAAREIVRARQQIEELTDRLYPSGAEGVLDPDDYLAVDEWRRYDERLQKWSESLRKLVGADAPPAIVDEVDGYAMEILMELGTPDDIQRVSGGASPIRVLAAVAKAVAARATAGDPSEEAERP